MCVRFVNNPKVEHGKAVKWLGHYLVGNQDKGLIMKVDPTKGLEVYPDIDFAEAWEPEGAGEDIDTARSRYGLVITYAGCPLVWKNQMQSKIALSSTESEFIGLATANSTAIPILRILTDMRESGFPVLPRGSAIHSSSFIDNSGALAIAQLPMTRPCTKHINAKYFQFLYHTQGEGAPHSYHHVGTDEQPAIMLTKPLAPPKLFKHRWWLVEGCC